MKNIKGATRAALLAILSVAASCNGANQLARIQNKTDLIAYVAIQSIQDSVNELKIQEIKPNQTSVLSYEVNGQPKRLAFALGFKPSSASDFTTYTVGPRSSAKGIDLILAPVPSQVKTIQLIKSEPYENGILGDGYVLYPIPRTLKPTNITALHIREETRSDVSTPPDYIPTEPIINYDEVDVTEPADSIETRIANLQKILEDIKALKPSNKELFDSMSKDELAQEYYRLNTELEDADYIENEQIKDQAIKQLISDISYIRSLLDR
jgi:hypothetical protein